MRFFPLILLPLALLAAPARAQFATRSDGALLIADPARAVAARDTLLQQAAQLRQRACQGMMTLENNAANRPRRRVVVSGTLVPPMTVVSYGVSRWVPGTVIWQHVTRYRRNGRVQERFRLRLDNKRLLRQRWLNGTVTWLSMRATHPGVLGQPIRHWGYYVQAGYVRLDNETFVLLNRP